MPRIYRSQYGLLPGGGNVFRFEVRRLNEASPTADVLWRFAQRLLVAGITRYRGEVEGHFVAEEMNAVHSTGRGATSDPQRKLSSEAPRQ
jgi:hypothetical protein